MPPTGAPPSARVPFARRLVLHKKRRTAVASLGIGFAVLVVFVQLGFYGAVRNTALAISDHLNADLVLISHSFVNLTDTGRIVRARAYQAQADRGVAAVLPIYFRYGYTRDPATGQRCRLFLMGMPLSEAAALPPLDIPDISEQIPQLAGRGAILMDEITQPKCGPTGGDDQLEMFDQATPVVGRYTLGVGFLGDGSAITSEASFGALLPWAYEPGIMHLGLIKLHPGEDPEAARMRITQLLPEDVRVVAREELSSIQLRHWVENTAVGNIFGMGTVVGFFVGMVVLYQILSTDIRNHLPLYATLKAMGYGNRSLYRYVLEQSWIFAVLGFGPAFGLCALLFPVIHSLTLLPVFMTLALASGVALLSLVMCSLAALLSMRRLRMADPAELF